MKERTKIRLCLLALVGCIIAVGFVEGWELPKGDPPTYVNRAGEIVEQRHGG